MLHDPCLSWKSVIEKKCDVLLIFLLPPKCLANSSVAEFEPYYHIWAMII